MPTDEEKLDQIDEKLKAARERSATLKTDADKLERAVHPPRPVIDHANDEGGVI